MAACSNRIVDVVLLVILGLSYCQATFLSFSYGVLEAKNETTEGSFCVIYYPNITTYPTEKSDAVYDSLIDLSSWDGCTGTPPKAEQISGQFVITSNGNCSIVKKAQIVQRYKGKGLLIVTAQVVHLPANSTYPIDIPVALIGQGSKDILVALGNNVQIFIYSPIDGSHMDYSLLVIWSLAVITVGIGAYWSGLVRHDLQKQSHLISQGRPDEISEEAKAILQEEVSLSVTPKLVAGFVLCMCGMLLLLYFFFGYLVYVIIGLFVLASTTAVYQCLEPILRRCSIGSNKLPSCNWGFVRIDVEVRQFLLFVFAVAIAASWVVYRKEKFAWLIQDLLGFAFSVNMIRQVRLPSLKICTLLLVLLFFYDIFFVFITPLFTKNGQSVMVEVATGGGSGVSGGTGGNHGGSSSGGEEQLPMVIRVPHLGYDPLSVCWQRYSLLGFGDILVPGMLVGFCHGFDLATANRRKLYYISTLIAYGLGLMVTFAGLYLMAAAQPALLYLVPFTLIPVFMLGLCRREFGLLWNGDGQVIEITRLTEDCKVENGGSLHNGNSYPDTNVSKESSSELASSKDRDALMN